MKHEDKLVEQVLSNEKKKTSKPRRNSTAQKETRKSRTTQKASAPPKKETRIAILLTEKQCASINLPNGAKLWHTKGHPVCVFSPDTFIYGWGDTEELAVKNCLTNIKEHNNE